MKDIAPAFDVPEGRLDALYVVGDPLAVTNRMRLNILALAARLPTMHIAKEHVENGRSHLLMDQTSRTYCSLRHDVVCAYHLAPAPGFVLDEGGRFGRRSAVRLDIERAEALLHIGHLEHLDGGLGDLIP